MADVCDYFFSRPLGTLPSARSLVERARTGPYDGLLLQQLRAYQLYGGVSCPQQRADVQAAVVHVAAVLDLYARAPFYGDYTRSVLEQTRRRRDAIWQQRAAPVISGRPMTGAFRPLGRTPGFDQRAQAALSRVQASRFPGSGTAVSAPSFDASAAGALMRARDASAHGRWAIAKALYNQYVTQLNKESPMTPPEAWLEVQGHVDPNNLSGPMTLQYFGPEDKAPANFGWGMVTEPSMGLPPGPPPGYQGPWPPPAPRSKIQLNVYAVESMTAPVTAVIPTGSEVKIIWPKSSGFTVVESSFGRGFVRSSDLATAFPPVVSGSPMTGALRPLRRTPGFEQRAQAALSRVQAASLVPGTGPLDSSPLACVTTAPLPLYSVGTTAIGVIAVVPTGTRIIQVDQSTLTSTEAGNFVLVGTPSGYGLTQREDLYRAGCVALTPWFPAEGRPPPGSWGPLIPVPQSVQPSAPIQLSAQGMNSAPYHRQVHDRFAERAAAADAWKYGVR